MIQIGTNFLYQGEKYLDERQSMARSLEDLKAWNVLVPEGFEIFVQGDWYIYSENINDPDLGHWMKRIDYEYENSIFKTTIDQHESDIIELKRKTGIIEHVEFKTVTSNSELRQRYVDKVIPYISWRLIANGQIVKTNIAVVNHTSVGVNLKNEEWYGNEMITETRDYLLSAYDIQGASCNRTITFPFKTKIYYGWFDEVPESMSLSTSGAVDVIMPGSNRVIGLSNYFEQWILDEEDEHRGTVEFISNVPEDKYFCYLFPLDIIQPDTLRVFFNGLQNSDIGFKELSGGPELYGIIYTNQKLQGDITVRVANLTIKNL